MGERHAHKSSVEGFVATGTPSRRDDLPDVTSFLSVGSRSAPWEFLSRVLGSADEDQKFWWNRTAPLLGRLMEKAQYSTHMQYSYLSWFYTFILPALGRRPGRENPSKWIPHLTHNHSPFEPSLNVQGTAKVVQFMIEPMSCHAGDSRDPFNQRMPFELMSRLRMAVPDLDGSWFEHFAKEFFMPPEAARDPKLRIPHGQTLPTCFVAFDLVNSKIGVKAYFFPTRRSMETGRPTGELVYQAAKTLDNDDLLLSPGLNALNRFLEKGGSMCQSDVEVLAIDCVKPSQARIQIYAHSFYNSFDKVRDVYTLGGGLKGETTKKAVEALKQLWTLLFGISEENTVLPHIDHPRSCIVYGFEIIPGSRVPEIKVYLPLWHYMETDAKVAAALSGYFGKRGWGKVAMSYSDDLAAMLYVMVLISCLRSLTNTSYRSPDQDFDGSSGTHTYLSFAYSKKTGLCMTMYYTPKITDEL